MTDKIKLLEEIIQSCTDKYGDNRNEIAKALFLLNEIKAAINYTHSCKSDSEQLLFSADEIVSKINEQTVFDGETFRVYFCEK